MTGRGSRAWRWLLVGHAAVVAVLTVGFLVLLATGPTEDANIGAGIVALPLLPLGLPWSLPAVLAPYRFDRAGPSLWYVVTVGPAWLNVLLHAVLFARRRRRDRPDRGPSI